MAKTKVKQVKIIEDKKDTLGDSFVVVPIWSNVDRPDAGGYGCGSNRKLAERLKATMLDNAVFENVKVKKDINGKTFASYYMNVRMRCANADLKKLGY